jgi:hypothetical protein
MRKIKQALGLLTATAAVLVGSGGVAMASNDSVASVYSCPPWLYGAYPSCADAVAAVNLRAQPNSRGGLILTIPKGDPVSLYCWTAGESINGDNVWYSSRYSYVDNGIPYWADGWVTGYYLSTGHDPAPQIKHC